jgi:hypothetical protein
MSMLFRNAGISQGADKATSRAACNRAGNGTSSRGRQPAGSDDGADTRDGHDAKTRQKAASAANDSADTSAGASTFGGSIVVVFMLVKVVAIVGDDADVVRRDSLGFQGVHGCARIAVCVKETGDGFHGKDLSLPFKQTYLETTLPW